MITYMEINNVQIAEDAWTSFAVTDNDLRCYYSTVYREDMTENEFFDLALDYVENYLDALSVADAKLDYYNEK